MHEVALARGILQAVLAALPPGAGRVLRVRGWLAETEALSAESLQLGFSALARGTAAEGAVLDLALRHVAASCQACGRVYLPEHHLTLCPACGSADGLLLGETGLRIEAVDLAAVDLAAVDLAAVDLAGEGSPS